LSAVRVQRARGSDRDEFVIATLAEHGASMLALARRYSLCLDDAHDAYQRAVEILIVVPTACAARPSAFGSEPSSSTHLTGRAA
jgi:hypothetical protein